MFGISFFFFFFSLNSQAIQQNESLRALRLKFYKVGGWGKPVSAVQSAARI